MNKKWDSELVKEQKQTDTVQVEGALEENLRGLGKELFWVNGDSSWTLPS